MLDLSFKYRRPSHSSSPFMRPLKASSTVEKLLGIVSAKLIANLLQEMCTLKPDNPRGRVGEMTENGYPEGRGFKVPITGCSNIEISLNSTALIPVRLTTQRRGDANASLNSRRKVFSSNTPSSHP